MPDIVIIGAGMAGLACGQALMAAGYRPLLLDKGRGAGGRMATRRITTDAGEISFDHGAQYFTVHDPAFQGQVEHWSETGDVARWTAAGGGAWVGSPAMNAPLKSMAASLDVRWSVRVTELSWAGAWTLRTEDGEALTADVVVLALPAEQSADLLAPIAPDFAERARGVSSAPCWTVMLAFAEPLVTTEDCLRGEDSSALGWAARNCSKPGRGPMESWVLQAGPDWSRLHLEAAPQDVESALMTALATRLGFALPEPIVRTSHRWRFARAGVEGSGTLWDADQMLGVCGDWLLGPRVEHAWLSGTRLGDQLALALERYGPG